MVAHTQGQPSGQTVDTFTFGKLSHSGSGFTRFTGAALPAAVISLGLLAFMQYLIGSEDLVLKPERIIDLAKVIYEKEPPPKVRDEVTPPPKPVPFETPPSPPTVGPKPSGPKTGIPYEPGPPIDVNPDVDPGVGPIDRGATPIFRVEPRFPARAPARGGCVIVGFTITKTGSVVSASVIESSSSRFHSSAMDAVKKFKYQPWISGGKPIATPNQSIRLVFQYEDQPLVDHQACAE